MVITEPGYLPEVIARDKNHITALTVKLNPDQTLHIGKLDVGHAENCLNWSSGKNLIIDEVCSHHFSEDNVQARNSNLTINKMWWFDLLPTLSTRHPDRILQAYAVLDDGYTLDPNGEIENIEIKNIKGQMLQAVDQGVMLSEVNKYSGFFIGNDLFDVTMAGYEWALNIESCEQSIFGGPQVKTNGGVLIKNRKRSKCKTKEVYLEGFKKVSTDAPNQTFIL